MLDEISSKKISFPLKLLFVQGLEFNNNCMLNLVKVFPSISYLNLSATKGWDEEGLECVFKFLRLNTLNLTNCTHLFNKNTFVFSQTLKSIYLG